MHCDASNLWEVKGLAWLLVRCQSRLRVSSFMLYLISHLRPILELLSPRLKYLGVEFTQEFASMAR